MDNVSIHFRVQDGTAQVVGSSNVVINGVSLRLGGLHGVWGSPLLGKVDNRVGLLGLDELDEQIIVLGNIEIDEFNVLVRDFLPGLDPDLGFERD
jgi:hypothetical protein